MARSITHASWVYPLKGIYYFSRHTYLWPLLRARLLPTALLSLFIYTLLFTFAYLPQALFLLLFHGPGAWFNAVFLTLSEGAVLVALVFEAFFVDETLVNVFDAVLVDNGLEELVVKGREVNVSAENGVAALGTPTIKSVYSPFSLRQILEFVLLLPLNLIPYAGVPLFLVLTGYRAGPLQHWRYFKLLGYTKAQRQSFVKARKLRYTWFGSIALLLQLVPVLSMFFLLTTAAGSALWAADLEKGGQIVMHDDEDEDEYRDDIDQRQQ